MAHRRRVLTALRWLRNPQAATWLALVVSAIAVTTSIRACATADDALQEERDVEVQLYAYANPRDDTLDGFGIRATFINEGLRPIIVRDLHVELDGKLLAPASAYLRDPRVLDLHDLKPDRVSTQQQPLPVTIPSRSAKTVAVLFDLTATGSTPGASYRRALRQAHTFCRLVGTGDPGKAEARLTISADLEPGGKTLEEPLPTRGPMDPRFSWFVSLVPDHGVPDYIEVRRKLAELGSAIRAHLEIWSDQAQRHVVSARVVVGSEPQRFPVPSLSTGRYDYAVTAGGDVVSAGSFRVPAFSPTDQPGVTRPNLTIPEGVCNGYFTKLTLRANAR
jgi:hypothetical protein